MFDMQYFYHRSGLRDNNLLLEAEEFTIELNLSIFDYCWFNSFPRYLYSGTPTVLILLVIILEIARVLACFLHFKFSFRLSLICAKVFIKNISV